MAFAPMGSIEVVDPSTVTLSGYATISGVKFSYLDPYQMRVRQMQFDRGAFSGWLARNAGAPLPVHWRHGLENFQIAETTELEEDDKGLRFSAAPMATSEGINALTAMAGRARTGASLIFDFGDTTEDRFGVEHIVDVRDVFEVGPTPNGVNPHAFSRLSERGEEVTEPETESEPAPAAPGAALAAEIYRALAHIRSL